MLSDWCIYWSSHCLSSLLFVRTAGLGWCLCCLRGEMDADGPDLSFACFTMHGTPAEKMLVSSQCVRVMRLCAPSNLLLKHPPLSHWKGGRRQTKRPNLCSDLLWRGKEAAGYSFEQLHCRSERGREALTVAKCQHDKSNLYKQSQL